MKLVTAMTSVLAAGIVSATCFAQTSSPPAGTMKPDTSSNSERDATRNSSAGKSSSGPASASSPHQREATGAKDQTMKECMDAQVAKNSSMSSAAMTKACEEQMKMQKERARMSKAPETMPKDASPRTPAPK